MSSDRRLKLPNRLLEELGAPAVSNGSKRGRYQGKSRKDSRKAERAQKKVARNGPPQKRHKSHHVQEPNSEGEESDEDDETIFVKPAPKPVPTPDSVPKIKPKSILKTTEKADPLPPKARSVSPPPKVSQKHIDTMKWGEDEEIGWLEAALGLKGKKGKKIDEFGDLLGELEGGNEDPEKDEKRKAKAEGDEWLDEKRRKAKLARNKDVKNENNIQDEIQDEGSEESEEEVDEDGDTSDESLAGSDMSGDISSDESAEIETITSRKFVPEDHPFEGFGSDEDERDIEDEDGMSIDEEGEEEEEEAAPQQPRVRENPYVAPAVDGAAVAKYIPPSMRKAASSDTELLVRLRRQTQGLVNRLTEANMIHLLGDIEKLYRDNPRQHITTTLVDLLLVSVCEPTSLPDTLIILPAGFIAAIYKIIGTDFGAQVVQRIVELFDEHYARASSLLTDGPASSTTGISKETSNLIMLLSELYNFQVVGSNLIFDYVRQFLGKLSELNAELLLKIIRTSGPQLRQDDPSALKDIVAMLRPSVASVGEDNISVRTKFMIETINDLKNNKMKTGGVASAVTSEHTIRMKKALGTLNQRTIKASEPLRIGLKDIRESDLKGKWWLVGASWSGPVDGEQSTAPITSKTATAQATSNRLDVEDAGTTDLGQLAREQRMNTEVRRAIFVAIMSATDFQDAYMRLNKLQLKKKQEFEIPKVLIHCSGAEKNYNPYYTLIAKRLCGDNKLKKSFQYCLWDLFKQMGEDDEDGTGMNDDGEDTLDTRHLVNLAKMFATLIVEGGLSLAVLKNLNLSYLQSKTKIFLEVLFISIFLKTQEDETAVVNVMLRVKDAPQLLVGLQFFLKKTVAKTDIAGGKQEKKTIKWACKVACDTLQELSVET